MLLVGDLLHPSVLRCWWFPITFRRLFHGAQQQSLTLSLRSELLVCLRSVFLPVFMNRILVSSDRLIVLCYSPAVFWVAQISLFFSLLFLRRIIDSRRQYLCVSFEESLVGADSSLRVVILSLDWGNLIPARRALSVLLIYLVYYLRRAFGIEPPVYEPSIIHVPLVALSWLVEGLLPSFVLLFLVIILLIFLLHSPQVLTGLLSRGRFRWRFTYFLYLMFRRLWFRWLRRRLLWWRRARSRNHSWGAIRLWHMLLRCSLFFGTLWVLLRLYLIKYPLELQVFRGQSFEKILSIVNEVLKIYIIKVILEPLLQLLFLWRLLLFEGVQIFNFLLYFAFSGRRRQPFFALPSWSNLFWFGFGFDLFS